MKRSSHHTHVESIVFGVGLAFALMLHANLSAITNSTQPTTFIAREIIVSLSLFVEACAKSHE